MRKRWREGEEENVLEKKGSGARVLLQANVGASAVEELIVFAPKALILENLTGYITYHKGEREKEMQKKGERGGENSSKVLKVGM